MKVIKKGLYLLISLLASQLSNAQISIDADLGPDTYSQDFDAVYPVNVNDRDNGDDNTWTNNSTLVGWYSAKETSTVYFTAYRISDGSETSVTRMYSYGYEEGVSGNTDRALGFQTSGVIGNTALAVHFENTGMNAINSISIHVTGEQWRRNGGCDKNRQRMRIGYFVDTDIGTTLSDADDGPELLINGTYVEPYEAFLVNPDTTSNESVLDGNAAVNQSVLSLTFPVHVPAGDEILIRFLDEESNCGQADPPIAIDDLTIVFSNQNQDTEFNPSIFSALDDCSHDIAQYLHNIARAIPKNPDTKPELGYPEYEKPTGVEYTAWTTILTDFFVNQNYVSVGSAVGAYGYELIAFPKAGDPSNPFQVLRKRPESTNYWGTIVVNPNASLVGQANNLNLQAPHTVNDSDSGIQGASVLMHTDAYSFVMGGADRCSNDVSTGCSGTGFCNDGSDYHSTADLAHDSNNLMDLAMRIIAQDNDDSQFVQLHGFASESFDFVVSNGTEYIPADPSRDFAYKLATELRGIDPINIIDKATMFDVRVPHKGDAITKLRGFTNNQGKWLNKIGDGSYDPCMDATPTSSNGRFIHLEQYGDIRTNHKMHVLLSNALIAALDSTLPVELISFEITEDGEGRPILTWVVASETNHSHYEVEVSSNGSNFTGIATVNVPIEEQPLTYQWIDNHPYAALVYFRLKQIDIDGQFSYLPTRTFEPSALNQAVNLVPNPARDYINLKGSAAPVALASIGGEIEVLKVHTGSKGEYIIDIAHLNPGIYFLRTLDEESFKFVKY